jgi:hypothetical protein
VRSAVEPRAYGGVSRGCAEAGGGALRGPTLASEHLAADDGLLAARETLRRWLRAAGQPAVRKRSAYRKRREPKAHFGELVQMDGSFHRWLEDRAGEGCLMHLADDAAS